ncbi:bifunctional diaminohydroxyphosphoribosylaminopyrimidine deaminase/5-amino-6-(5-phosphoribosylamino)uracil reductase RibD [Amycolatopsis sp. H20-H5]|uniref:bifunctional diaminohydroxyphosphoribosylaminopyrimidine deaminase/5-amino-6-(5-phosphoribosylamino)uracil reductase RibD n=1 Tax=Amycolatopsis sp. H20-H5 TaxID=3046309 RepID=UPI002DB8BC67|nr:bifunctional diaminohydroxyphosphoribosylaminopyrimidine deaminase/5-amino-6-(5-phosphoribosylamino)uracil reductase RibD [Amycolatopsis sp. H20-H5]MEC3977421.1 bifunctional diaminohydroxyphosphoribosylaminopyrimidine deaminase/5-amino-6-(5-phosphoribosylamino)uracil reductase RibD [Amycolatopsis sp. H20-H5]
MASPVEEAAMLRAIALSAFGLGSASPNPPVGCVILDAQGEVVGEGFHLRKGEAHAEVNALNAAGLRARGGTAVVTLEPCNHEGRTPPCRQALIDAGIRRVVIALIDPTSREEGGAARLQAAGADVEQNVLGEQAQLVIGPWLTTLILRRPVVHWTYVSSGSLPEPEGEIPDSEHLALRAQLDAVLTSTGYVEEGTVGAHNADVFSLPSLRGQESNQAFLYELFERGVRSLLVTGYSRLAQSIADDGLVDQATIYLRPQPMSAMPSATSLLPQHHGLSLASISNVGYYVRVGFDRPPDQGKTT